VNAREDFDFHTYWSITKPPEDDHDQWIARHQVELHRVLAAAESQQHLPPNWQAWAEQPEPEPSALHKVAVWVLLDTAAALVLLVVGRIVWQGISTVVGL